MDKALVLSLGRDMTYLVACALHGRLPEREFLEKVDFANLYKMAKFHNMQSMICILLTKCRKVYGEEIVPAEDFERFNKAYQVTMRRLVMFDIEREALCSFIGERGWYLCLKGVVMQNYYPVIGMRQMADNDILVDPEVCADIRDYFVARGYEVESFATGCHDSYLKGMLNFEIHRKLFSSVAKTRRGHDYYGNVREMLIPGEKKGELLFSDDDFYVYFLYHAYKHYATAGCGIRTLADIYLYRKKNTRLNPEYINSQLEALGIAEYEENSRKLAFLLFDREATPEIKLPKELSEMLDYYITSGVFGTTSQLFDNAISDVTGGGELTGRLKLKYLMSRLFPSIEYYREHHPRATKWIIPIPFLWLMRVLRVFTKTKVIAEEVNKLNEK